MSTDHTALWRTFQASSAAPTRAMPALALDGYLTGVIVAPSLIRPTQWMAGVWANEEPVFDDPEQMQSALSAVSVMFNTLSTRIEQSLRRLDAEHVCDYRPAFLPNDGKPSHDAVGTWVSGFWKVMALVPAEWSALAADERTRAVISPFVAFIDIGDAGDIELATDISERLDDAAAQIPRAILLLRKIARSRANRTTTPRQTPRNKIGRNEPCPCGSGKKFKRCCG